MKVESYSTFYFDHETQFYIIGKIKNCFPTNRFYLLIFIIFKFLGILVITNNGIGLGYSQNKTFGEYTRRLLYFHDIDDDLSSYNIVCFLIYGGIIISLTLFIVLWKNIAKNIEKKKILPNVKKERIRTILTYVICFFVNLIVFFSQHLIEILSLIYLDISLTGYYGTMPNSHDELSYIKLSFFINKFEQNLFVNNYILCVTNTFFIIVINIISYFYLKNLNDPFISSDSNMQYSSNKSFIIFFIIISNFSSVHYLDKIFPSSSDIKIILLVISLITIFIFRICFKRFIFKNLFNYITKALCSFCIFSIILEFIIYANNKNPITSKIEILRVVVQVSLALVVTYLSFWYSKYKNLQNVSKVLFHKTKVLDIESLNEIINILKKGVYNGKYLNEIFKIIHDHKRICKDNKFFFF
jgi:hypothetical protein